MSYILDALRRADAERERGSVPGLNAQPAMLGEADSEAPPAGRAALRIGITFGLVLTAAIGWWLIRRDVSSPPAAPVLAAPVPVSPAPAPEAPPPLVVAVPTAPAPAPRPPPAAQAAAKVPERVPAKAPEKVLEKAPDRAPERAALPQPVKAQNPAVAAASAASTPAAAEPRVYQLSELPDEIRRELPSLVVGGAMYSPNPANRLLIVNGQPFREGDSLSPNLLLQQIRLKSAVLEYKGYRYGITY